MIPENMMDKNCYYAHHEDFGHLTNDCRNLYEQVMCTTKKVGLQPYMKKDNGTMRMVEQPGLNAEEESHNRAENDYGKVATKNSFDDSRSCSDQ